MKLLLMGAGMVLLVGIAHADEPALGASNSLANVSSITNYHEIADQLNNILNRTTPPKQMEAALQGVFDSNPLEHAEEADWPRIRSSMAETVLTSLVQLEAGIRQTAVVTNIDLKPPDKMSLPFGAPIELIKDPEEREQMVAYGAGSRAHAALWNMHQALLAEYRRHWNRAITLLADMYSRPPAADAEIHRLIDSYPNYECTREFSNQVYQVNKK